MKPHRSPSWFACVSLLLCLAFLGVVFFLAARQIVAASAYPDFFTFWLAGHLLSLGQSPYDAGLWLAGHARFGIAWIPNQTFIYPLPLGLLFTPFGLLPYRTAFVVWLVLLQFMMLAAAALLLKPWPPALVRRLFPPLLAGLLIFRPTILTVDYGQLSGMLLLVLAGGVALWEKEKWWQGGAVLALLALKPNLGVPILALLSFYLLLRKRWAALAAEAASGLALLLAGWAVDPGWVGSFLRAGGAKLSQTFGFSPTVWGASTLLCAYRLNCVVALGGTMGLVLLAGVVTLIAVERARLTPSLAAGLAVAATLLLTPYTWTYDQFLLALPIFAVLLGLAGKGGRPLPAFLIFMTIDVLAFVLLGVSARTRLEVWSVAVPLAVLGLEAWYLVRHASPAGSGTA